MKRLLAIVLAAGLAACSTTPSEHATEAKSIAVAWSALDAAAVSIDVAVKAGYIKGAEATTVAGDLNKADEALTAATVAYRASDDATAQTNVVVATTLISELVAIAQSAKQTTTGSVP